MIDRAITKIIYERNVYMKSLLIVSLSSRIKSQSLFDTNSYYISTDELSLLPNFVKIYTLVKNGRKYVKIGMQKY